MRERSLVHVTANLKFGSSFSQRKVSTPILTYKSTECCFIPTAEVHPTESLVLQQPIFILTKLTQNRRNLLCHKMHCLLSQPESHTMLGLLVLHHHHHSSSSCSSDEENSFIAPDKIPTTTWLSTLGEKYIYIIFVWKCKFSADLTFMSMERMRW